MDEEIIVSFSNEWKIVKFLKYYGRPWIFHAGKLKPIGKLAQARPRAQEKAA